MKKYIIKSIIGTILMYLISAFIKWEFNPGMWGEDIRVISTLFLICWLMIAGMIND